MSLALFYDLKMTKLYANPELQKKNKKKFENYNRKDREILQQCQNNGLI